MRKTNEIPQEEWDYRMKRFKDFMNEPYIKILSKTRTDIFLNPNNNAFQRNDEGLIIYGFTPEAKELDKEIENEIMLFRQNKYTDLLFDLEHDHKLNEVKTLMANENYKNLIKGIIYHSGNIHADENEMNEIRQLNIQIDNLIRTEYPTLLG